MPVKEASFSENTRASYQMFLDRHILPAIGDRNLADVTPAMLTKLLLDFQRQGYAHASAVKLFQVLNGLFKMAFLDETIAVNPMLRVQRPRPRKGEQGKRETEKAYTVEETRYILQCMEKEPLKWRVYVALLVDTGARKGEACGLQWADIDFSAGAVTIQRSLQYTRAAGVYATSPKNGKSRTVDVGRDVLELLAQLREEQAQTAISKWVFTQEGSPEPMQPQTPTHYFRKLGERYGISDFHPHKLRHTSASIGITCGADVVSVSQRLGHSDSAVTLRMYAHANEKSIRRAGQIVRDALKSDAAAAQ